MAEISGPSAALAIGTTPTVVRCDSAALAEAYPRIIEAADCPVVDTSCAALLLLSVAGIVIFYLLSAVNYLALRRWHESALQAER